MIYRDIYRNFPTTGEIKVLHYDTMKSWQKFLKRSFDIIFSFIGLISLSWLFVLIYIAIKFQHDGSVFFKQERIGKGGKPFTIYKFRTMSFDAEKYGPQLEIKNDSRLTPLGKILREHHIDELPQLFNILIGDMSFVGPRPERRYFIDKIMKYDSRYKYLYEIRPGLTSEATLHNGYTDTMEKMLKRLDRDLYYLENRSLAIDAKIMLETIVSILIGKKI